MTDKPSTEPRNDIEAAEHIREVTEKLKAHARAMGFEKLADLLEQAHSEAARHIEAKANQDPIQ